jgi:hypothetical protein
MLCGAKCASWRILIKLCKNAMFIHIKSCWRLPDYARRARVFKMKPRSLADEMCAECYSKVGSKERRAVRLARLLGIIDYATRSTPELNYNIKGARTCSTFSETNFIFPSNDVFISTHIVRRGIGKERKKANGSTHFFFQSPYS